jgi:hypothetical protein
MSSTFFASHSDLAELAEEVFSALELVAWQRYSDPGHAPIKCETSAELKKLLSSGEQLLSFWVPGVMPPPSIRAIDLHDGGTRQVVEGCGLFSLNVGHITESLICASDLSWFTEAGARAQCSVLPGPEATDWVKHKQVGSRLTSLIRRLKVASSPGRPVLRGAWRVHLEGGLLKEHRNAPYTLSPSATSHLKR